MGKFNLGGLTVSKLAPILDLSGAHRAQNRRTKRIASIIGFDFRTACDCCGTRVGKDGEGRALPLVVDADGNDLGGLGPVCLARKLGKVFAKEAQAAVTKFAKAIAFVDAKATKLGTNRRFLLGLARDVVRCGYTAEGLRRDFGATYAQANVACYIADTWPTTLGLK